MSTSKSIVPGGYTTKKIVYLIIGLFFFFGFGYVCPIWSTITPVGVSMLGAFLG